MATKLICDGCGHEIPKRPLDAPVKALEGLRRSAQLEIGGNCVQWDLCAPCLERAAGALAEVLPHSPRKEWNHILGLGPRPEDL